MTWTYSGLVGVGSRMLFWASIHLFLQFYGFTWLWVHIIMRNHQNLAQYYSIDEAINLSGYPILLSLLIRAATPIPILMWRSVDLICRP